MDTINLGRGQTAVVRCEECDHRMINLDADQLRPGDLTTLKNENIRISNPETEKAYCINCDKPSWFDGFNSWTTNSNDHDDTPFFGGSSGGGFFGGGSSFGGFGGGSFSGGGASGGF